jgi:hypothetical protein
MRWQGQVGKIRGENFGIVEFVIGVVVCSVVSPRVGDVGVEV